MNFWDRQRAQFLKKIVTVGTKKIKIICAETVSVGLSYSAIFKWHMQLCEEIYRAEQKYKPFFGTVTERDFRKNQSTETYTNDATLHSGFFPPNALGDGPAFWIFFPGFTDKGKISTRNFILKWFDALRNTASVRL